MDYPAMAISQIGLAHIFALSSITKILCESKSYPYQDRPRARKSVFCRGRVRLKNSQPKGPSQAEPLNPLNLRPVTSSRRPAQPATRDL